MRADIYLYENSYCKSRNRAKQLIESGSVSANGRIILKPSEQIPDGADIKIDESKCPEAKYVGRGALKLEHALEHFGVDVSGRVCCDIGASTGGFTQVLLRHGAAKVYAVDSGENQLDETLRADARVVSLENTNARYLTKENFSEDISLVVMDVSFISQTLIYPAIVQTVSRPCDIITLVKPQFETMSKSKLGKNGVIKDEKTRRAALENVINSAKSCGFKFCGSTESPITGTSGNVEYLIHIKAE